MNANVDKEPEIGDFVVFKADVETPHAIVYRVTSKNEDDITILQLDEQNAEIFIPIVDVYYVEPRDVDMGTGRLRNLITMPLAPLLPLESSETSSVGSPSDWSETSGSVTPQLTREEYLADFARRINEEAVRRDAGLQSDEESEESEDPEWDRFVRRNGRLSSSSESSGGKRTKQTKRTKRAKRTKRTKRAKRKTKQTKL